MSERDYNVLNEKQSNNKDGKREINSLDSVDCFGQSPFKKQEKEMQNSFNKTNCIEQALQFHKIIEIDNTTEKINEDIKKDFEIKKAKNLKLLKSLCIIFFAVFIILMLGVGFYLGTTKYAYESTYYDVIGSDAICYVTNYGECYHASTCGYLKSRHQMTVKEAVSKGYRPCSACYVGTASVVKKTEEKSNPKEGIKTSAIIFAIGYVFLVSGLLISFYKKDENLSEKERISINKNNINANVEINRIICKYSVVNIIAAPEDIEIQNGRVFSYKENMYRYVSTYGKCYHSNKNCGNRLLIKKFKYDIVGLEPCLKCAEVIQPVPNWYLNYRRLQVIFKKYNIEVIGKPPIDQNRK